MNDIYLESKDTDSRLCPKPTIIMNKYVQQIMMFEDKIELIVDRVTEKYDPKAIIVFGSVARGDSTEDSDLDIAIIMDSDLSEHERNVMLRVCIGSIGMAMDLLVFTPEEIEAERDDDSSIISEIMRTGEVVYGSA